MSMHEVASQPALIESEGTRTRLAALVRAFNDVYQHGELKTLAHMLGISNLEIVGTMLPFDTVPAEQPRIEDPEIRNLLEKNLAWQERMYRTCFGFKKLLENPEYLEFKKRITEVALAMYKRGYNYFGMCLGDDVLGPGKGVSLMSLYEVALKRKIVLREVGRSAPKAYMSLVLSQSNQLPLATSYGYWTKDSSEPDKALIGLSGDKVRKRKLVTQGCLEHQLFIIEHHLRRRRRLPNAKLSTLCDLPSCPTIPGFRNDDQEQGRYYGRFSGRKGTLVTALPFAETHDVEFSHRVMIKVELPKR